MKLLKSKLEIPLPKNIAAMSLVFEVSKIERSAVESDGVFLNIDAIVVTLDVSKLDILTAVKIFAFINMYFMLVMFAVLKEVKSKLEIPLS